MPIFGLWISDVRSFLPDNQSDSDIKLQQQ